MTRVCLQAMEHYEQGETSLRGSVGFSISAWRKASQVPTLIHCMVGFQIIHVSNDYCFEFSSTMRSLDLVGGYCF